MQPNTLSIHYNGGGGYDVRISNEDCTLPIEPLNKNPLTNYMELLGYLIDVKSEVYRRINDVEFTSRVSTFPSKGIVRKLVHSIKQRIDEGDNKVNNLRRGIRPKDLKETIDCADDMVRRSS